MGIKPRSQVVIVKKGRFTGRIGTVTKDGGRKIEVRLEDFGNKAFHFFRNQVQIHNA